MCAIFGSYDKSMFEVLYEANKERGNFASSIVTIGVEDVYIGKFNGNINFDKVSYGNDFSYVTGHVQAPTSSTREWSYDTSHPFETLSWLVSHNGVLTNEEELRDHYVPHVVNPVDTALIVELLQYFTESEKGKPDPVKSITKTLNVLQGTFALSIIDTDTSEIYLARSGSVLHYDRLGNFSTNPGIGYTELPEGDIMRLNKKTKRWNKVGTFEVNSPFIFL